MKSYACLKCGKGLAGSECVNQRGRWVIRQLCPACGALVCLSGPSLVLLGLIWLLMWGMILNPTAQAVGVVGGSVFIGSGLVVMVRQKMAKNR